MRPFPALPITPPFSTDSILFDALSLHHCSPTVDEALKLNIEDKDDSSPRRPSTKRARPTEEQAPPAVQADSSPEASGGRPKRKAAPPPATEAPVKGRGKKAKTDAGAPSTAAPPPVSKGKKSGADKKAAGKADEDAAARDQQEADEVDALADEPAENGTADSAEQGNLLNISLPSYAPLPPLLIFVSVRGSRRS